MTANALFLSKRINVMDPAIAALLGEVKGEAEQLAQMKESVEAAHETLRQQREHDDRLKALLTAVYVITTEDPKNSGIDGDDWPNATSDVWLSAVLGVISTGATS